MLLPVTNKKRVFTAFVVVIRAGYLTFFERTDNAAAAYQEFRKFDNLLAKLARGSLRRGKLHCSLTKIKQMFDGHIN